MHDRIIRDVQRGSLSRRFAPVRLGVCDSKELIHPMENDGERSSSVSVLSLQLDNPYRGYLTRTECSFDPPDAFVQLSGGERFGMVNK